MRNNWNLFIVCFLCVLCFQPYQVNAQTQSQKKITIEISNERLPSVLKRLEKLSRYKILFTYAPSLLGIISLIVRVPFTLNERFLEASRKASSSGEGADWR